VVLGYNIYRSNSSGSGYVKQNSSLVASLNYSDASVQSGLSYFYVTTAVDASGTESVNSNEAQAIIP
jgi:fibronectin type 3 domain-containing protein